MVKIPETEYEAIAKAYAKGESQPAIANRYRVSHACISKILRKMNHPRRMGCSRVYRDEVAANHAQIVKKFKQGLSYAEIGEELGFNPSTIIWVLQKFNLWVPAQSRDPEFSSRIASSYKFGLGIQAIKKRFSCSEGTVYQALEQFGIQPRSRGHTQKAKGKSNAIRFRELYSIGYSLEKIAEDMGFSEAHVERMIEKYFPGTIKPHTSKPKRAKVKIINDTLLTGSEYQELIDRSLIKKK